MSSFNNSPSSSHLISSYICVTSSLLPPCEAPNRRPESEYPPAAKTLSSLYEPQVSSLYPEGSLNPNEADGIMKFAMPRGVSILYSYQLPKIHYFVQTREDGSRCYAVCLTLWEESVTSFNSHLNFTTNLKAETYDGEEPAIEHSRSFSDLHVFIPTTLVLLSLHPYLPMYRLYLTHLFRLTTTPSPVPIERYIQNLTLEVPSPPRGTVEVMMQMMNSTLKFWAPPANQPIPWVAIPFSPLFTSLPIPKILEVWTCLSLERQVLLVSHSLTLLTECCEILISLLFPMSWTHCYIPCLPTYLLPVLSAPMPYICGIAKSDLAEALLEASPECVIVDLDLGTVKMGSSTPKLPSLPSKRKTKLEKELTIRAGRIFANSREGREEDVRKMDEAFYLATLPEDITEKDGEEKKERGDWDSVQEAFFRFYIALLKDYRRFLVFPTEDQPMNAGFQAKPFVLSQPKDFQSFLSQLCATQQFDAFITKRLYRPGEEDVTFFEESIDAKMNRYKMKLKKIETPFLQSAKVQRKLKTVVAPEPSREGLEQGSLYSYNSFPSSLDPSLFGAAKPLPTVIAEENRKRVSRARLRTHSADFQPSSVLQAGRGGQNGQKGEGQPAIASASSATFTVFFMAYTAVVGRDLKELEGRRDDEFEESRRDGRDGKGGARFNRLSSADEDGGIGEGEGDGEGRRNEDEKDDASEKPESVAESVTESIAPSELYESAAEEEISVGIDSVTINSFTGKDRPPPPPTDGVTTSGSNDSNDSGSKVINRVKSVKEELMEEARVTAKAQLDLAFEVLLMMRKRGLMPESIAYQCLIDACGRCGDTDRVCELLGMMHEDGVVADSVVYSCLVKAFSVDTAKKKDQQLPSFTNGYSGAVDWNKMRSGSVSNQPGQVPPPTSPARSMASNANAAPSTPQQKLMSFFKAQSLPLSVPFGGGSQVKEPEYHLTSKIKRQVALGNSLLDVLYRDIYLDTFRGVCNVCSKKLSEADVCDGWAPGESHEYRVTCKKCKGRGVVRFSIFSTVDGWTDSGISGQEGKLFCEYLSPWVLKKELLSIMSDSISTLLDPNFPKLSTQKATIYWNLIVSFRREKLPFAWMFQGSFGNSLITPSPDDMSEGSVASSYS